MLLSCSKRRATIPKGWRLKPGHHTETTGIENMEFYSSICLSAILRVYSMFYCTVFVESDHWTFHRNGEEWRCNRVLLNKEVISPKVLENFVPLLDEVGNDFVVRVHKKIARSGQNKWTTDLSQELFKYALECKTDVSNPRSTATL